MGITGTYVDDSLLAGDSHFEHDTRRTLYTFESRERLVDNFTFAEISMETISDGFELHQHKQISSMNTLPGHATFKDFKSLLMKLSWVTHTVPQICCGVVKLTQMTEEKFSPIALISINKNVKVLKETSNLSLN